MKSRLIGICLCAAACGGTTNGATCGPGTTLVNGQCVVASGGAGAGVGGSGSEPEAGTAGGEPGGTDAVDSGPVSVAGGMPITWNSGGWISGKENPFGIEGWWWADNDCKQATAANLPCDEPDTTLTGPGGSVGWSISSEEACLKGTMEAVTDWSFQWGADMGFGLTADSKTAAYDASALKGFAFDITGTAPSTIKIVVEMPNIKIKHFHEVAVPSTDALAVFTGPDAVAQGPSVAGVDKVAFDPKQLTNVFFVPGAMMGNRVPYDFCVRNVRVLQ
jgi:hypothetical protein